MTKVAIKNENITSFGGIYHIMDVFSKLGFEKLTESVLGKRGSSGKAFSHGSIFGSLFFSYLCGGECLEDINALIGQFKQRQPVILNKSKNIISYVADFNDKSTGEQTYVVTDKRLGENPSIMKLASVKKVMLLYRGLKKSSTNIK